MRTYKLGYSGGEFTSMVKGKRFRKKAPADLPKFRIPAEAEFAKWLASALDGSTPPATEKAIEIHEKMDRPEVAELLKNRPPAPEGFVPGNPYLFRPKSKAGPISWTTAIDAYIALRLARTGNEEHMVSLRAHLQWLFPTLDGTTVNHFTAEHWEKIFSSVTSKKEKLSPSYRKSIMATIRQFLVWCHETDRLKVLPLCVKSTSYQLKAAPVKQPVFTPAQIKTLLADADDRMRAWILVALNCGCTQKDLAKLTVNQIQGNLLRRKRTKHEHLANAPIVIYHLWPETLEAIRKTTAANGLIWPDENGKELVKNNRNDQIAYRFKKLTQAHKMAGLSFKSLRKTGTTVISWQFKAYKTFYLANSPSDNTDKHYDQEDILPKEVTDSIRKHLEIG